MKKLISSDAAGMVIITMINFLFILMRYNIIFYNIRKHLLYEVDKGYLLGVELFRASLWREMEGGVNMTRSYFWKMYSVGVKWW